VRNPDVSYAGVGRYAVEPKSHDINRATVARTAIQSDRAQLVTTNDDVARHRPFRPMRFVRDDDTRSRGALENIIFDQPMNTA
jgi:hypothetical protein